MARRARARKGTGSVYRDADRNRWTASITIDGKRRRVHGRTRTEAQAKLSALLRSGGGQDGALTVSEILDEWFGRDLAALKRAPSTVERHRWAVDHITAKIGTKRASKLTVRNVEAMLDALAAEGLGQASLTKIRQTLSLALQAAVKRDDLTRNVAGPKLATLPSGATAPVQRQSLTPDQARTLLAALHAERNGLMFALSLRLGLRPGEAAALYWEDIAAETVNITRGLQRSGGKVAISDDLKTKSAKRTLGLPADLAAWFDEHRKAQRVERIAARTWHDDRLVFTGRTGGVCEPAATRRHLAAICATLVDFPNAKPNELRHSCASLLADEGMPYERIADVLGHTTTRMVDTTYRHRLRPTVTVESRWQDEPSNVSG